MDEHQETYYVDIGTGHITRSATNSTWSFRIHATNKEISWLRNLFNQNYSTEWQNFFRAHVPYVTYHHDWENDVYDSTMQQIYSIIYELGDEEAKQHIKTMKILPGES